MTGFGTISLQSSLLARDTTTQTPFQSQRRLNHLLDKRCSPDFAGVSAVNPVSSARAILEDRLCSQLKNKLLALSSVSRRRGQHDLCARVGLHNSQLFQKVSSIVQRGLDL